MERNVGGIDRIVRGVLGIWLLAVAFAALRARRRTTAAVAGIAGLGLLQNAATRFCGGNWLLGIDTTGAVDDSSTDCAVDGGRADRAADDPPER